MPIAQNQPLLDYAGMGTPWVSTLAKSSIDPDGLDLTYGGAPFYASLGEVSTSILRSTQLVVETLREVAAVGGGNLRASQVAVEILVQNSETIYLTQFVMERLSQMAQQPAKGKSWMVFDPDNHLDVYVSYGTAPTSAAADVDVLNGANHALWGDEVIGFRDVASLGGGLYRLSRLLRGRFGTEWAMNSHALGDRFVLLDLNTIRRATHGESDIGVGKLFRAVTVGQTLSQASQRGFANYAKGLKPYAPCYVRGSRDGSNNLTISWLRRSRYNAEWRDAVDVPIGESSEAYEVDILTSTGTVVRTLTGLTTASAAYSAANQTTDFGGVQLSLAIVVYQLSGIVGRGYGTSTVV